MLHDIIKWILGKWYMLYAKVTGKRFYCQALTGDSDFSICINSDLSVSCNCQDYAGTGKIGDNIRHQSLFEIFSGEKASSFRRLLASGRLPILPCSICRELRWVDKKDANVYLSGYHTPTAGIMVENTVNCNLSCLTCRRKQLYKVRTKRSMTLDDVKYLSSYIREHGIKSITYYNLGEPFFSNTIKEEMEIIRNENPEIKIVTSTNGILIDSEEKRQAALYFDRIEFSIDGSTQESVNRYQRGGDFNKAYSNMKAVVELRNSYGKETPVIEWKYLLFRWSDSSELISKAIKLAKEAKVDMISFQPTLSPIRGISYRYYLGSKYLRTIFKSSWKVHKIDLRQDR